MYYAKLKKYALYQTKLKEVVRDRMLDTVAKIICSNLGIKSRYIPRQLQFRE